jgi:site-specific recombinase XerD
VPFGATTKKWLMLYRDRWRPRGISDRFFLNKSGKPLSNAAIAQMVKKYGKLAAVPGFMFIYLGIHTPPTIFDITPETSFDSR